MRVYCQTCFSKKYKFVVFLVFVFLIRPYKQKINNMSISVKICDIREICGRLKGLLASQHQRIKLPQISQIYTDFRAGKNPPSQQPLGGRGSYPPYKKTPRINLRQLIIAKVFSTAGACLSSNLFS